MNRYRFEAADATGKIESGHLEADSQARRSACCAAVADRVVGAQGKQRRPAWRRQACSAPAVGQRPGLGHAAAGQPARRQPAAGGGAERDGGAGREKHIAQTLSAVRADVRSGMRLAEALAARPRDFPRSTGRWWLREESGDLAQVMERLADYIEERNNLRGKILTAFIYPGVVGLVSIGIVIFLLSYVVPQVVSAFSQARQDLPGLTLAMLTASDFMRAGAGCVRR
jgi:general secretion pathway protein F